MTEEAPAKPRFSDWQRRIYRFVPHMGQLRIARNGSYLKSLYYGIVIPLFWLPSELFMGVVDALWCFCLDVFQFVVELGSLILSYGSLILCGLMGDVNVISLEQAEQDWERSNDDED